MGDYKRSTRKCSYDDFRPVVSAAIKKCVEMHDMGDVAAEALICCETTSEKLRKGLFGKAAGTPTGKFQYTDIMVTPRFIFWGVEDIGRDSTIWARLENLEEVRDYRETYDYKRIPDTGISLFGFCADAPEKAYSFIGLGEDQAAEELMRVLLDAWDKAR